MNWLQSILEQCEVSEADEAALKRIGFRVAPRGDSYTDLVYEAAFDQDNPLGQQNALVFRFTFDWTTSRFRCELGVSLGEGFDSEYELVDLSASVRPWLLACKNANIKNHYTQNPDAFKALLIAAIELETALFSDRPS